MKLILSPIRGLPGQAETTISVLGDVLSVDGIAYDLSLVPEGGQATPQGEGHPFVGNITREGGTIHATLRVTLGDDTELNQPDSPWAVSIASGAVTIPADRIGEASA